jgi:hypothetical protein
MVIIGMMSYPPESAEELSSRFLASPPIPAFMIMRGPYLNSEVGVGIKTIILYEFEKSKIREAYAVVLDRYAKFIGVPGFTFSVQLWLEMSD